MFDLPKALLFPDFRNLASLLNVILNLCQLDFIFCIELSIKLLAED